MNSFSLQLLQISLWHPRRGTTLLLGQYPPKRGSSLPLFRRRTAILLPDRQLHSPRVCLQAGAQTRRPGEGPAPSPQYALPRILNHAVCVPGPAG